MNTKQITEEFSFSLDGETYRESCESRIEAIKAALDHIGDSDPDGQFWTGRNVPFTPNNPAEIIIEQMQEWAYDDCGEHSENYLTNVTKEQEQELNDLILGWLERVERPTFWSIADDEAITVRDALELVAASEAGNV